MACTEPSSIGGKGQYLNRARLAKWCVLVGDQTPGNIEFWSVPFDVQLSIDLCSWQGCHASETSSPVVKVPGVRTQVCNRGRCTCTFQFRSSAFVSKLMSGMSALAYLPRLSMSGCLQCWLSSHVSIDAAPSGPFRPLPAWLLTPLQLGPKHQPGRTHIRSVLAC